MVDGTANHRLIIPRGMVQETGEATLGREQEIRLPITFAAMSPTSGTVLGTWLTHDPGFA